MKSAVSAPGTRPVRSGALRGEASEFTVLRPQSASDAQLATGAKAEGSER